MQNVSFICLLNSICFICCSYSFDHVTNEKQQSSDSILIFTMEALGTLEYRLRDAFFFVKCNISHVYFVWIFKLCIASICTISLSLRCSLPYPFTLPLANLEHLLKICIPRKRLVSNPPEFKSLKLFVVEPR